MKKKVISISLLSIILALSITGIIYWTCQYIYCFATDPQPLVWYASHKFFIEAIIFHVIFFIGFIIMLISYIKSNNVFIGSIIGLASLGFFSIYKIIDYIIYMFKTIEHEVYIYLVIVWFSILALSIVGILYAVIIKKKKNE